MHHKLYDLNITSWPFGDEKFTSCTLLVVHHDL